MGGREVWRKRRRLEQKGREERRGRRSRGRTMEADVRSCYLQVIIKGMVGTGLCMFKWAIIAYQMDLRLLCCVFFYLTI